MMRVVCVMALGIGLAVALPQRAEADGLLASVTLQNVALPGTTILENLVVDPGRSVLVVAGNGQSRFDIVIYDARNTVVYNSRTRSYGQAAGQTGYSFGFVPGVTTLSTGAYRVVLTNRGNLPVPLSVQIR